MSKTRIIKAFFADNLHFILKMFVTQIGMTVFGLILSMACAQNDPLLLGAGIFAILFYLYLLYSMCWEVGATDQVRIDAGRMHPVPLRMTWCSLVANLPNVLLALLSLIGVCFSTDLIRGEPVWASNLYGVPAAILRLLNGMYMGVISTVAPSPVAQQGAAVTAELVAANRAANITQAWLYLLAVLPAIAISTFGYQMALHGRSIGALFGINPYKHKK